MKNYDELFFTDDFMFCKIMRDPEIAKGVVESLLGIKVKKVDFLNSQFEINESLNHHGIRLDAYLEDSDRIFDIEMQTIIRKDEAMRMRYYQSMIDTEHLNKGESYNNLKETYIIFLCMSDPFDKKKAVYDFVTKEKNGDLILNDRTHKIIYNADSFENAENAQIRNFLNYLKNHSASDVLTKRIQTALNVSKKNIPWRSEYMLWRDQVREWKDEAREEGLKEGMAKGKNEGAEEKLKENILNLLLSNIITPEQIADALKVPLEKVLEIQKQI